MRAVEGAGPRTGGGRRRSSSSRRRLDPHRPGRQPVRGPRRRASRPRRSATPIRPSSTAVRDQVGRASHVSSALGERGRGSRSRRRSSRSRRPGLDRVLLGLSGVGRQRHGAQARPHADRPPRGHRVLRRLLRPIAAASSDCNGKAAFRSTRRARRRTPTSCRIPYPYRWPLGPRRGGRRAGASRWSATRSRTRRRGSGRSPPSSSSRSRATAASSSRPTGSSQGCASCATGTASCSSSTRSSAGFGRTGRTWAAEHWGVVAGPDDRRQGHRRRAGAVGGHRSRGRS